MTAGFVPENHVIVILSREEAEFMKKLFEKADNGILKAIYAKVSRAIQEGE